MTRIALLFLMLNFLPVSAIHDFVLYTQPKTGSHFLWRFLEQLTGRERAYFGRGKRAPRPPTLEDWVAELHKKRGVVTHISRPAIPASEAIRRLRMTKEQGCFIWAHAPYSPNMETILRDRGYRVLFISRDPRDYCVSAAHYSQKIDWLWPDVYGKDLPFEALLREVIVGSDWFNGVRAVIDCFLGWRQSDLCLTVEYSAMLGPRADPTITPKRHLEELRKIADFLAVEVSDQRLLECHDAAYGTGYTYRTATVGQWRDCFTEELKDLIKKEAGDLIMELGYEENNDW